MEEDLLNDLSDTELNLIEELEELDSEYTGLKYTKHDYPSKRYGRGNPYSYCTVCQRSIVDITDESHKTCPWIIAHTEYHYKLNLLPEEVKNNIDKYFEIIR